MSEKRTGTVEANGIRIWYETFGSRDDPAILLIMGLGAQAITWPDQFCERLAAGGRYVIRFDNRDVGLSQHFEDNQPYTLDDMAADAVGLLDALQIARAHIVGASMGGMIAQLVAIRYPQRVLSLTSIMSNTGGPPDPNAGPQDQPRPEVLQGLMQPPAATREDRIEQAVRGARLLRGGGFPLEEDEARRRAAVAIDRAWHPAGTAHQGQAIMRAPSRIEALRQLRVPALVIHGDTDPLVPYRGGVQTAEAIPGARLVTIHGMGHELPRGAWNQIIGAILDLTA